ncbi:hypothetical protein JCGZ_08336 [Jatropha curcas]|uniref:Major facilitator superfamily (MFS) profile domain-containing protein n=1 Tax=Jatropha curcas TaxID=180498 RepID=A0A067KXJ2_JATCU|nr:hypothetical protein JCGZ_08336 [Jatropha curcas]
MEDWERSNLPKAAAIINIQEGVAAVVALIMAHVADAYIGRFTTVILTTAAYIIGLMLLWFSSSFLSHVKIGVFYLALALIALGTAGKDPPFKAFLADQLVGEDYDQIQDRTTFWWRVVKFIGAVISVFFITRYSWKATFMISTIVMGTAYLWFLVGIWIRLYHRKGPTGSPLTTLYRVTVAAIYNWQLDYPLIEFSPRHPTLSIFNTKYRWMDKASIRRTSSSNQQPIQESTFSARLLQISSCTETEVKHAKRLLTLIPLWMTFLMYSVVQASGNTFFIEQTDGMKIRINADFDFPITFFFIFQSLTRSITSYLANLLISKKWRLATQQRPQLLKINSGMAFSIMCCLAAWQVEVKRLKLMKECGCMSSVYENNKISMSVLWLLPQFFLLGLMEGLAEDGLSQFFYNHVDESMKLFETPFNGLVIGIGRLLTLFFILLRRSWFGDSINHSRLDKYFRWLMILSCCNLCFCGVVSYKYANLEGHHQPDIIDQYEQQQQQLQQQPHQLQEDKQECPQKEAELEELSVVI